MNRLFFIFLLTIFGSVLFSQEIKQDVVKPDWDRDRNFYAVLKQMNVSYKERRAYYFHENYPILATEKIFGDTCLSYRFKNIENDSGFRLSKKNKNYWYFLILVNDSVLIIDDRNIKDFLTPINSMEKLISYFHYEVKLGNKKEYENYNKNLTIEEDGYSFLILDWNNIKRSRIKFFRLIDFEHKRTPLLKIRIFSDGNYTFEKVKICRETRDLKHSIIDLRYF
jgi:hypothetical protein